MLHFLKKWSLPTIVNESLGNNICFSIIVTTIAKLTVFMTQRALALDRTVSYLMGLYDMQSGVNDQQFCLTYYNQPKNSPKNDVIWGPDAQTSSCGQSR
jgi:hypothetical protein